MCGRYALFTAPHKLKDLFGTENLPNFPARYNAAPLQTLPVIVRGHTACRMGMARWGFLPPWSANDDKTLAAKMINARSETVSEKAAFRDSWQKGRRCLIPADGFYEWHDGAPYYIYRPDHACLAFAGLWAKSGDLVTFAVLTKEADGAIAALHRRSPVLVDPAQAAAWFAASPGAAQAFIKESSAQNLVYHAVDAKVGKAANDTAELIAPLTSDQKAAFLI